MVRKYMIKKTNGNRNTRVILPIDREPKRLEKYLVYIQQ
jgi:hypothetical protein